jgi:hypothetical protein
MTTTVLNVSEYLEYWISFEEGWKFFVDRCLEIVKYWRELYP